MEQELNLSNSISNNQSSFDDLPESLYPPQALSCPDLSSFDYYFSGINNSPNIHPQFASSTHNYGVHNNYLTQYDIYGREIPNSNIEFEDNMERQNAGIDDSHSNDMFFSSGNLHSDQIE